jgi:hypothetical protein
MIRPIERYRPERHYMREPGPKWLEKHSDGIVRLMPAWTATALTNVCSQTSSSSLRGAGAISLAALRHRRNTFGSTRLALLFTAMAGGPVSDGQRIGCREDPTCDANRLRRGPLRHDFSIAMPVGDIGRAAVSYFSGSQAD